MDIGSVLIAAIVNALLVGILVYYFQKSVEQRLTKSLEEFKANLQGEVFVRQAWWERKAQAYSEVIASLVDIQYYTRQLILDLVGEETLDDETKGKMSKVFRQRKESLHKVATAGAYIVSEDTVSDLQTLLSDLDRDDEDWYWLLNAHHSTVERCIASIRAQAKADLLKLAPTEPEDS
jgi:hypothetical protein